MKKTKLSLEDRLQDRKHVASWRRKNPEKAKQHYRNWILKKKGSEYKPKKSGAYYGAFDRTLEQKPTKPKSGGKKQ